MYLYPTPVIILCGAVGSPCHSSGIPRVIPDEYIPVITLLHFEAELSMQAARTVLIGTYMTVHNGHK